ncbi:hypothetical protein K503DRAFT_737987 [Rhizopogon vinicolor AM-OR11-026]|uniref:Uncharacterized protein n=1 Tax=Rhizopogon vinicolor AM-OR11-026 TaxID=1314800 RepID=A0A1B7N5Q4_9AGAM|nr:hypothetical protein K503DRAFT_737987 [Rhizopogon vinicolor AM-OR11-026]
MLSIVVGCFVLQALALQVPLHLSPPYNSTSSLDSSDLDFSLWQLDELPPANATGHFVFETVNSLLQHWPNTRYPNGHTMVPGVIPKGTLLYHGAFTDKIPTVRNWVATDPEHSMLFCKGNPDTGCWHLTLATTRPLKVLYFDGTSAANTRDGTLETQDIMAWGELKPEWWWEETERLENLCNWGAPYAVDGYVRMEMDFEVMLCDFTAGLEVVSFYNLASLLLPVSTLSFPTPRMPKIPNDFKIRMFEVMHAGSWHNRYPGDTRINLDLAGIVSLYDTTLAPSLVSLRAGQERCDHRLQGISHMDIEAVRSSVSRAAERSQSDRSGVDWKTLFRVIVDRYSDRLDLLDHLLNSTLEDDALMDQARKVHLQLRVMFTPYIFHNTVPPNASFDSAHSWAAPVFKACGTAHTSSIASYMSSLNPSERLLLQSVQETTREICRITTKMWAAGVLAGLDPFLPVESASDAAKIARLVDTWRQELSGLMAWLDWSVWVRCRPTCGPEEMCYLPSWPLNSPRGRRSPYPPHEERDDSNILNTSFADRVSFKHDLLMQQVGPDDDRKKPQPKCIRRVEPYGF